LNAVVPKSIYSVDPSNKNDFSLTNSIELEDDVNTSVEELEDELLEVNASVDELDELEELEEELEVNISVELLEDVFT
jgi:hypothetical protein